MPLNITEETKHVWHVNTFQFYLKELNLKNPNNTTEHVRHNHSNPTDDYFVTMLWNNSTCYVVQTHSCEVTLGLV